MNEYNVQASRAAPNQPKKDALQQEGWTEGSDDTDEGNVPKQGAAEDDTIVAEMMKVDWKVRFVFHLLIYTPPLQPASVAES